MSANLNGLRAPQAAAKLGISVNTLWVRAKREPEFPKPVKVGGNTTIWLERELDAYLRKCIAESRNAAPAVMTNNAEGI